MSGTIATDANLSASGTINLSFVGTIPNTRYAAWESDARTSVTISSLAAGTYLLQLSLVTDDSHSGFSVSVSGASALVPFPAIAIPGTGSPQLGITSSGIYTVSSTGDVTISLNSYSGLQDMLVTATPVTT